MKKKSFLPDLIYRGRFAPSPTGPLHFGSLVAAVGSYLQAKRQQGTWLVRMEDVDVPRTVAGAADDILRTLEIFGLHSDEPIIYQSQRTPAYVSALQQLKDSGVVYPCCCTRKEIADSVLQGIEGVIYPGTCRDGMPSGREGRSWRVRADTSYPVRYEPVEGYSSAVQAAPLSFDKLRTNGSVVQFNDALQGCVTQHLEKEVGDFVVKRADGLFAYQLAVVVDDASQGITHVVRGCDLLTSTPRQIHLQRLLGLSVPNYLHLPIAVNAQGEKLSKQTLAPAISKDAVVVTLIKTLDFLRQQPPDELRQGSVDEVLNWAVAHWRADALKGVSGIPCCF